MMVICLNLKMQMQERLKELCYHCGIEANLGILLILEENSTNFYEVFGGMECLTIATNRSVIVAIRITIWVKEFLPELFRFGTM